MFYRNKGKQQQQQGNKYQYGEEREEHDNLEFDGELEDLENDDQVFNYEHYGNQQHQQKAGDKAHSKKIDFLKNLADQKGSKEKDKDAEMDFILDDPDGLESLSDY